VDAFKTTVEEAIVKLGKEDYITERGK